MSHILEAMLYVLVPLIPDLYLKLLVLYVGLVDLQLFLQVHFLRFEVLKLLTLLRPRFDGVVALLSLYSKALASIFLKLTGFEPYDSLQKSTVLIFFFSYCFRNALVVGDIASFLHLLPLLPLEVLLQENFTRRPKFLRSCAVRSCHPRLIALRVAPLQKRFFMRLYGNIGPLVEYEQIVDLSLVHLLDLHQVDRHNLLRNLRQFLFVVSMREGTLQGELILIGRGLRILHRVNKLYETKCWIKRSD